MFYWFLLLEKYLNYAFSVQSMLAGMIAHLVVAYANVDPPYFWIVDKKKIQIIIHVVTWEGLAAHNWLLYITVFWITHITYNTN